MDGLKGASVWSPKRDLLLPLLMRLDQIKPVGRMFRSAYRTGARGVARALRRPGVTHIYLRRGIAKNEFMPFLSDIDLLVITSSEAAKEDIKARLGRLQRLVPMLESQSPVLTGAEFHAWLEPGRFADNRSFLYRILEARNTWDMLYSRDDHNPLDATRRLGTFEVIAVIFSEILFWHRIVISEYTAYRLAGGRAAGLFQRKRYCWIFMKATTELHNFLHALQDRKEPLYTRREIIQSAIEECRNTRWEQLFADNLRIINNRFAAHRSDEYILEAIAYIAALYREYYRLMSAMLDGDPEFLDWAQMLGRRKESRGVPEYHQVDLAVLTELRLPVDVNVAAVCVSQQPLANHRHKLLVSFVLRSLAQVSAAGLEQTLDVIARELLPQGIRREHLETLLVDYSGFRCFGMARMSGNMLPLGLREDKSSLLPPLYDRIFTGEWIAACGQAASGGATGR